MELVWMGQGELRISNNMLWRETCIFFPARIMIRCKVIDYVLVVIPVMIFLTEKELFTSHMSVLKIRRGNRDNLRKIPYFSKKTYCDPFEPPPLPDSLRYPEYHSYLDISLHIPYCGESVYFGHVWLLITLTHTFIQINNQVMGITRVIHCD